MDRLRGFLTVLALVSVTSSGVTRAVQDQDTTEAKARKAMIGKMAPELVVDQWINSGGKALSLKSLRGKVVVLDFFTFW